MKMVLNLQLFFETVLLAWAKRSSRNPFASIFFVLLSFQLSFRSDYVFPIDYLTKRSSFGVFSNQDNACEQSQRGFDLNFDFIIVGAGAAGSVIAYGLSENPNWNILLIEAGGDPAVESVVPLTEVYTLDNSKVWRYHYETVDSSSQAFLNGRPIRLGKQLGGTTENNAGIWVCGQNRDYDSWESQGNPGWSYKDILPYIKKSENNQDKNMKLSYHGTKGPVPVSSYPIIDSLFYSLRNGFNEINYTTLNDYNAEQYNGFVSHQATVKKGERCGAYRSFIQPIKERSNLFIVKNGLVTNILLNGTMANGVNVKTSLSKCPNIKFYALKETILSAGAIASPKILLQSGIGSKSELEELKITVVKDLPGVGNNLQDHAMTIKYVEIDTNAPVKNYFTLALDAIQYIVSRTGYFSQFSTFHLNAFINATDVSSKYSDIQLIMNHFPKNFPDLKPGLETFGFKDEFITQITNSNKKYELIELITLVLNPKARGKVSLRGKDPDLSPKILSNFFTNEDDIRSVIQALNKTRELLNTKAFQKISAKFLKLDIKQCNPLPYLSDEYERCYLRYLSGSLWSPAGTCKMGPSNDNQAVVDTELKVHGIENLRVVDASVMPSIPSGNVMCPTYAIGQKAVEMIKKSWAREHF